MESIPEWLQTKLLPDMDENHQFQDCYRAIVKVGIGIGKEIRIFYNQKKCPHDLGGNDFPEQIRSKLPVDCAVPEV